MLQDSTRLLFLDHYMCRTHQMLQDLRGYYFQVINVQDSLDALGFKRLLFPDHYMCRTHQMLKDLRGQYVQLNIRLVCLVKYKVSMSSGILEQDALKRLVCLVENKTLTHQMLQDSRGLYFKLNICVGRNIFCQGISE